MVSKNKLKLIEWIYSEYGLLEVKSERSGILAMIQATKLVFKKFRHKLGHIGYYHKTFKADKFVSDSIKEK